MKKALSVLVFVFVLCSFAFAGYRVTAAIDPFSFQDFVKKNGDSKVSVKSSYGIGGSLGFGYLLPENLSVGSEVKANTYFLEGKSNYTDVSILAKAGYVYDINDSIAVFADLKGGLDIQLHGVHVSCVGQFGFDAGARYSLDQSLDLFASVEALFGFLKNGETRYSETRITPSIGVGYTF